MSRRYNQNFSYSSRTRERKRRAWASGQNVEPPIEENKEETKLDEKRLNSSSYLLEYYVSRSSVHGVRYILDPELYTVEKLIWLIFVIVSIFFTARVIIQLATEFQAAPTVIVIESTSYKISALPFPSVTICPRDRVDWKKAMALEKEIVPSNNTESVALYRKLITILSSMSFARYGEVSFLKNTSLNELADINVTDIMYKVVPSCDDLFSSCWWRYHNQNCCEILQLQKSEYGFCYSFNSASSEYFTDLKNYRRTSGYGERSGLKVTVHLENVAAPPSNYVTMFENETVISKEKDERWQDLIRGATIIVDHPEFWPSSGQSIGAGMSISVNVKCTSGYATQDVLNLSPDKIPCRYKRLDKDAVYNQQTCISECRRSHVKKHCECNPSYYFPTTDTRECNVKDFICLVEHNGTTLFDDTRVVQ